MRFPIYEPLDQALQSFVGSILSDFLGMRLFTTPHNNLKLIPSKDDLNVYHLSCHEYYLGMITQTIRLRDNTGQKGETEFLFIPSEKYSGHIKGSALRPGSKVYAPHPMKYMALAEVERVRGPKIFVHVGDNYYDVDEMDVQGICLTSAIMQGLGFRQVEFDNGLRPWIKNNPDTQKTPFVRLTVGQARNGEQELKFLHELQIHFLEETGNELPIEIEL